MSSRVYLLMIIAITILFSCNNTKKQTGDKITLAENKIIQQEDGTISLIVDKAQCYHDMVNPASNTAEWNVVVSKSGRFNVWLSSSTKDTTDLQYRNSVMLSILDNRLEAHPECDKIIQNTSDINFPYFRADSFMGSLYIQDTGIFNIQVISEKIVPKDYKENDTSDTENSKLVSVILTPVSR
jgi:hypothetical protein